jgi:hypothetical protein
MLSRLWTAAGTDGSVDQMSGVADFKDDDRYGPQTQGRLSRYDQRETQVTTEQF